MYKIFTCNQGAKDGATVQTLTFKDGTKVPAIIIGEVGRGREQGVLPVKLLPENQKRFERGEAVEIFAAEIGMSLKGKPKLIEKSEVTNADECICVLRTNFGFRGSNSHTGDITLSPSGEIQKAEKWPGVNLISGYCAQGTAGRMGGGNQFVSKMPKDVIFRESLGGRMYGRASEYFYLFNGYSLECLTAQEREVADRW